ncbi:MAG TPA: ABC transporter permease [Gemmatimonadaceae bacterium]|nr:ABC transporter permease [Gemmatimonadaceae bacterium]
MSPRSFRPVFHLPAFTSRRARDEMDEELRFHLETRAELFRQRGYSAEEAMREALRRFGAVDPATRRLEHSAAHKEKRMRIRHHLRVLRQDVHYALRGIRRAPGFAAAVLVTLALGLGANTAIFSVVRGVLLRPLPYADPAHLVVVWNHWTGWPRTWLSQPEVYDYARDTHTFAGFAAFTTGALNVTGDGGNAERVNVGYMQASLLDVTGVHPIMGRGFTASEDQPNGPRAVLLLQDFWKRRYGGDRSIIGRTIRLDDQPYTVVGILPSDFRLPLEFAGAHAQLFVPLQLGPPNESQRGSHGYNAVARLAPGMTLSGAQRRLDALVTRIKAQHENQYGPEFGATLVSMAEQVRGDVRPVLYVLLGAVSFVLLIACANVASLFLARTESRARELAVRAALGAGRGRLATQLLTESILLALCGGVLGVLLAIWAVHGLAAMDLANLPRLDAISIDGGVLAYTAGVALITGVVFGLGPIMQLSDQAANEMLKQGRGNTGARSRMRLRHVLVALELTLAMVALTGAALMTRSFARLVSVPPGFASDHVLTMRLSPPAAKYATSSSVRAFYAQLLAQVRALPGVERAGAISAIPLTTTIGDWSFTIDGAPKQGSDARTPAADWLVVTGGYFDALHLPILRGRGITAADRLGSEPVVVISEATAQRYFKHTNPVGQRIKLGGSADSVFRTIVGVAGDVRFDGLDKAPRPTMYLPLGQFPATVPDSAGAAARSLGLVIRTQRDPAAMTASVRTLVRRFDADVPVAQVRTLDDIVGRSVSTPRLAMYVLVAFGVLALTLAAVGVYAVMSYVVAQRTGEIGVRVALGARAEDVMRLVIWQSMRPVLLGLAVGTLIAVAGTRAMTSLLYSVKATDPVSFIVAIAALVAVALAATWRPARRAARVDPIEALRVE